MKRRTCFINHPFWRAHTHTKIRFFAFFLAHATRASLFWFPFHAFNPRPQLYPRPTPPYDRSVATRSTHIGFLLRRHLPHFAPVCSTAPSRFIRLPPASSSLTPLPPSTPFPPFPVTTSGSPLPPVPTARLPSLVCLSRPPFFPSCPLCLSVPRFVFSHLRCVESVPVVVPYRQSSPRGRTVCWAPQVFASVSTAFRLCAVS